MFTPEYTKQHVSHQKENKPARSNLRRLNSATNIVKSLIRRHSNNKENISSANKEHIHTSAEISYPTEGSYQSLSSPLADMPPPMLNTARPRQVPSPHPRKGSLPRSVTMSNIPVPKQRLPSTQSSISLLSRDTSSNYSQATVSTDKVQAKAVQTDRRRSRIPTPTRRTSDRDFTPSSTLSRPQQLRDTLKQTKTPSGSWNATSKPPIPSLTPQKLKHRQSKSPERREASPDKAAAVSKRMHSAYNIVHHGLMKAISPQDIPPPKLDKVEGKRLSLARSHAIADLPSYEQASTAQRNSILRPAAVRRQSLLPVEERDAEPELFDGYIRRAQPTAYWTGRFVTLNDRYMSDEGEMPKASIKGSGSLMHAREEQRAQRVLEYLENKCLSDEARKSLWQFRTLIASTKGMPTLLTAHKNSHINNIGNNNDHFCQSPTSTTYTVGSERPSLDLGSLGRGSLELEPGISSGLGMPTQDRLPKGPERVETRPRGQGSWASATESAFGKVETRTSLPPPELRVDSGQNVTMLDMCKSEEISPLSLNFKSIAGASHESPDYDTAPQSPLVDGSTSLEKVLSAPLEEKERKKMGFVEMLLGRSRKDRGGSKDSYGSGTSGSLVYEGT